MTDRPNSKPKHAALFAAPCRGRRRPSLIAGVGVLILCWLSAKGSLDLPATTPGFEPHRDLQVSTRSPARKPLSCPVTRARVHSSPARLRSTFPKLLPATLIVSCGGLSFARHYERASLRVHHPVAHPMNEAGAASAGEGEGIWQTCSNCKSEPLENSNCQQDSSNLDLFAGWGVLGTSCTYNIVIYSVPAISSNSCISSGGTAGIQETGNGCTRTTKPVATMELNSDCTGLCPGYTNAYTQVVIPAGCTP